MHMTSAWILFLNWYRRINLFTGFELGTQQVRVLLLSVINSFVLMGFWLMVVFYVMLLFFALTKTAG